MVLDGMSQEYALKNKFQLDGFRRLQESEIVGKVPGRSELW